MTIDGNLAAAGAMAALEKRLEVATTNLAGVQKAGYQWRQATTRTEASAFERELGLPPSLVKTDVSTSFVPGMPVANANPLSLALKSEGFFEVKNKDGALYTRNGDFVLAADGTLTTRQGFEVVGASGRLKADPSGGTVEMNDLGNSCRRDARSAASTWWPSTRPNASKPSPTRCSAHPPLSRALRSPRPRRWRDILNARFRV
jgi:flagellar hook-basal body protein